MPAKAPWPRLPTTSRSACSEAAMSAGAAWPSTTTSCTSSALWRPRTLSTASASSFRVSSAGSWPGGHVGVRPHEVGHSHAMTASTVAPVTLACATAQCNASRDDPEPSIPTTITPFFSMPVFILTTSHVAGHHAVFGSGQVELHEHDPEDVGDVRSPPRRETPGTYRGVPVLYDLTG